MGHEPNGYFWEGVALVLVSTEAPGLEGQFSCDSEGGMFCAYGDEPALRELATLMSAVVSPMRACEFALAGTDQDMDAFCP